MSRGKKKFQDIEVKIEDYFIHNIVINYYSTIFRDKTSKYFLSCRFTFRNQFSTVYFMAFAFVSRILRLLFLLSTNYKSNNCP